MPTYDPTAHPRLSAEAAALSSEVLGSYADEAEALLGIVVGDGGTAYTGVAAEQLTLAVALQVNRSVRLDAHGGGVVEQEEKGDQSYRVSAFQGRVARLDPDALRIAERILSVPPGADADTLVGPMASGASAIVVTW